MPGGNYGWPYVHGADHGSWLAPSQLWHETIAPSGLAFVTLPGSRGRTRRSSPASGARCCACSPSSGARVVADQPLLEGTYGRLRAVTEAPDGSIWVTTSNRDGRGDPVATDDRILRIVPPAGGGDPLGDELALDVAAPPAPVATPRRAVSARGLLVGLSAPLTARVGRAVRILLRFRAVPAGAVALQRRLPSGRWATLRLVRPKSRNIALAVRPPTTGRLVLRVRHRDAGRAVDRKIVLNVRR